jgi:uncharacterized protein YjbI with pentapeptide repeats
VKGTKVSYQIKHRYTGAVLFECELPADLESGLHARHALEKATAARANLAGANLAGANLAGANLAGTNLARANLEGANRDGANLDGAYLARANLAGANLDGANLAGANLDGANLDGAIWRPGVVLKERPIQLYGLTWPTTILDAHMQIGCQFHSLHDWDQFDDATIAAMDGRDALRFWRANKTALLGLARGAGRSFEKQEVAA